MRGRAVLHARPPGQPRLVTRHHAHHYLGFADPAAVAALDGLVVRTRLRGL